MKVETMNTGRDWLLGSVLPDRVVLDIEQNLGTPGARTIDCTLNVATTTAWLGDGFAEQRLVAATPGLAEIPKDNVVFAGGVCALDPFTAGALRQGLVVDAKTGVRSKARTPEDVYKNLLGPVTLAEAMGVVGITGDRTIVVAETGLWSGKIAADMELEERRVGGGIAKPGLPADLELVEALIANRNGRILDVAKNLRQLLFPGARPFTIVQDSPTILYELRSRTYGLYQQLGLPIDKTDAAIPVLGMYTDAWRRTLLQLQPGLLEDDTALAIYEPTRHMGASPENIKKSTMVRTMLEQFPYLQPGVNEKVAALAFVDGLQPNGLPLVREVPPAFQPNSDNFETFDFSRYPKPIDSKNPKGTTGCQHFDYWENLASLDLAKNPAFLWAASLFPPTPGLMNTAQRMIQIAQDCKDYLKQARAETWPNLGALSEPQMNALSALARSEASKEMEKAAQQLIVFMRGVCAAAFCRPPKGKETLFIGDWPRY